MMRAASTFLAAAVLAGCAAGPGGLSPGEERPRFRDPALTVQAAGQALVPGQTRRQDLLERLGPAEVVRFDTGYEVWVYRARNAREPRATPELVVLLDPAGVVSKVRVRPAYVAQSR
jgi:hypothetical protein